jgi:hypothetical protein
MCFFVQRCHDLTKNFIRQLASLYPLSLSRCSQIYIYALTHTHILSLSYSH